MPARRVTRVLLADVAGTSRRALAGLLSGLDGVTLVGEASDRSELAGALRRTTADVLVIDDRLLSRDSHVLAGVGPHHAGLRVIVLGIDDDPAFSARALRLGAERWIVKDRAGEELPALLAT
ncbi:MAG TPA: hypothetical protein VH418_02295 [Solirubrobacteraceae bacterium]|jgi:DNA-binding NarL/FixJ family response regulator